MSQQKNKETIDFVKIIKTSWGRKKLFFKVWGITFALACLWIFPQPRYYKCDVMLAPEMASENVGGSLSSIASNFGINLGGANNDAIYPELYPDLLSSNEFIIGVLGTQVTTLDKSLTTDYYTYLSKHQKTNWLTQPFIDATKAIKRLFTEQPVGSAGGAKTLDPFILSEYDYIITEIAKKKILCYVNKKTEVITITFTDQDPYVAATMADSVKQRLQDHIINYRTNKARIDVMHYKRLADSALVEYNQAADKYSRFCDRNQNITLQTVISERDKLENEMQMKLNTYTAMNTQLEATKVKLQERTPAFTTLKSATVPIKPAGPKRMIFVAAMLFLATFVTIISINFKEVSKLFAAK